MYLWEQFPPGVSKQLEYAGVRLGMNMKEVKYIKGFPNNVAQNETEGAWKGFARRVISADSLEAGKSVDDYEYWSYDGYNYRIDLQFDKSKRVLTIFCYSSDSVYRCPAIAGIEDGYSEQQLLSRFGPPDTSSIDGVTKIVRYTKVGVIFYLTKEKIYMLGISVSW
jgi:hypothetical protein